MKTVFDSSIRQMLQGLCYWMGYSNSIYSRHSISEPTAVEEAVKILLSRLDKSSYAVDREVPYEKFGVHGRRKFADIAILNRHTGQFECVMEFKVSGANGGYLSDLKKMCDIKNVNPEIDCLSIVISERGKNKQVKDLLSSAGIAKRNAVIVPSFTTRKAYVRRASSALSSIKSQILYRAICVELV